MEQQTLSDKVQKNVDQFKTLDEKICHYSSILSLLSWDAQTGAPKKGRSIFAKAKGTLSTEKFQLSVSKEMGEYLEVLSNPAVNEQLDEVTRASVKVRKHDYNKKKSIPPEVYNEYVVLQSSSSDAWEHARANNDFVHFQPYLEKMVEMKKRFIEYYGYEGHPYNTLLDDFEPGLTVDTLVPLFADLSEKSIDLLRQIQTSEHQPNREIFEQEYDIEQQRAFSSFVIPKLGFDMEAGRLDVTTAHPVTFFINTGDARSTTHYALNNVRLGTFVTMHETGHAVYEQGINPAYEGTAICGGASRGFHESQSRFFENMVGRSEAFWNHFYGDFKSFFPEQLKGVSGEEFYRAVNLVEPSFIRMEADELTYNMHIIIRYEIEKGLFSGEIKVKDLPYVWNEKMEEYLGIIPMTHMAGVLQDIHWSKGWFGCFPSYTLGNLYAAQILNTIKKQIPALYADIENGEFVKIRNWLKGNIHEYGKLYTPNELIKKVTGEELKAKYLMDYLEEKYSSVYKL